MFFVAMIVGLMEIGPGVCQLELLNPNGTINTSRISCEDVVPSELVSFPHRHTENS